MPLAFLNKLERMLAFKKKIKALVDSLGHFWKVFSSFQRTLKFLSGNFETFLHGLKASEHFWKVISGY